MDRIVAQAFLGLVSLLAAASAFAVPMAYTSRADFDTALSNAGLSASTLDFDATAAGTLIPDGGTLGGVSFHYPALAGFGVSLAVTDGDQFGGGGPFATTSGTNFLGTDDADLLQDGDNFDLSFGPVNAIGMFFITADTLVDDDIELTAGGVTAALVAADVEQTLPDGSDVYFLGIIDDMNTFSAAGITTIGGGFFLYNVDDITTAVVPLPSAAPLLGGALTGWAGVGAWRRRGARRRAGKSPAA